MEERSYREISNNDKIIQRTRYFRFFELILCLICLLLAIFFWTSVNALTITTVIFATSLSFFIITLIDVIAGMSRNQYTITAWVGIAFLAAFMFFLSFGLLLFRNRLAVAVLALLVTAVVFLIDGTLIICYLFKIHSSKRVHPTTVDKTEVKESTLDEIALEEFVQTDTSEPINESPAQVRTYAPRASTMSRRSFPITTYGGTFPCGGKDDAPLPTPDNLTGLEPTRSSQIHVTRRSAREATVEDRPRGMEDVSTQKPSIYEGSPMYPPLEEDMVEKRSYAPTGSTRPKTFETYEQSEISSTEREVQAPMKMCVQESEACEFNDKVSVCRRDQEDVQTETNWSYNPEDMQGRTVRPCQAAGEPLIQQPLGVFTIGSRPQDYQRRNCPSQECHCCKRDPPTRDQVTPFVSHHYDQSPCICGYTHYQASTVVRGAVRQYPQDTVHEQQKMIQAQLEQTRQVYGSPHVCGCHEQATPEPKQPQTRREPQDNRLIELDLLSTHEDKIFEVSNISLYGSRDELHSPNKYSGSSASYGEDRFIFEEDVDSSIALPTESTKRRVTIANEPTSSSQGSTTREYESWLKRMMYNETLLNLPDDQHRLSASKPKTASEYSSSQEDKTDDPRRRGSDDETVHPDRTPTVMKLTKQLYASPETGEKTMSTKKRTISPSATTNSDRRMSEIPNYDERYRGSISPSSENTDSSPPRKRRVVPCIKRCWETPERKSTMKSLYRYEGPSAESTFFGDIDNLRTWGTEITTTTTVRTTNFGSDKDHPMSVCEKSTESSYSSTKSPRVPDIPHETIKNRMEYKRNSMETNTSLDSRDDEDLGDYKCFVPCCTLPPLDGDESVVPIEEEEQTELEEIRTEVSALGARLPADELELRRRSILKNRKQIDEDIREELAMVEEEPEIEGTAIQSKQIETSLTEKRRTEGEERNIERQTTLDRIRECVKEENTEEVETDSKKWQKIEIRKTGNETVVQKMTCGCICKCLCKNAQMAAYRDTQRKRNKSFDIDKYNVTSLSELPYHPRDDYKVPRPSLIESIDRRKSQMSDNQVYDADYFWENPIRTSRVSKVPETFNTSKWTSGHRNSETLESTRGRSDAEADREDHREERNVSNAASSVPKRGPVKRVHPTRK